VFLYWLNLHFVVALAAFAALLAWLARPLARSPVNPPRSNRP
jgi:hypothetical protein